MSYTTPFYAALQLNINGVQSYPTPLVDQFYVTSIGRHVEGFYALKDIHRPVAQTEFQLFRFNGSIVNNTGTTGPSISTLDLYINNIEYPSMFPLVVGNDLLAFDKLDQSGNILSLGYTGSFKALNNGYFFWNHIQFFTPVALGPHEKIAFSGQDQSPSIVIDYYRENSS